MVAFTLLIHKLSKKKGEMPLVKTVKVCDALCGFGKTSAAINLMNNDEERRFIFATQYLTEVERIKNACPERNFVSPEHKMAHGLKKLEDLHALLNNKENIATTHALLSTFNEETVRLLKENRYVLIIDEIIDANKFSNIPKCDLDILIKSGAISDPEDDTSMRSWLDDDYDMNNGRFAEEAILSKSNNFIRYDDAHFFWSFHPEIFKAFDEVYVLTYLFAGQPLKWYFDMYDIGCEYIGVKKTDGAYTYCPIEEMDRSLDLRSKIHILDNKKLNSIGDMKYKLSYKWYSNAKRDNLDALSVLNRNVYNFFRNIVDAHSGEVMWTTYKEFRSFIQPRSYSKSFIPYNKRATNEFSNRKYLAYCINLFPRPWEVKFFSERGADVKGDMYALGYLVQWIFRSAIRNGEEIWIYIPSRRMRWLLKVWMNNLAEGRDLETVEYTTKRSANKVERSLELAGNFSKKGVEDDGK